MIVLHGLGDSMEGYTWMRKELRLPWLNLLLVNAPDPYFGGYSWYDIHENPSPGVTRSRELLVRLLDEWKQRGHPTEETVLFGFSQGCLLTYEIGVRYPHRLAGLVGVSGYVFEPEELLRHRSPVAEHQKFFITHGTQDALLPIDKVRKQVELLQAAGLDLQFTQYPKEHTIHGQEEILAIRNFLGKCYSETAAS